MSKIHTNVYFGLDDHRPVIWTSQGSSELKKPPNLIFSPRDIQNSNPGAEVCVWCVMEQ
jgi:hypothetical protein